MKKFQRFISWFILNVLLAVGMYLWLVESVTWARNLTMFYLLLSVFCITLLAWIPPLREQHRQKGRCVWRWLDVGIDWCYIIAFAATGHFLMAITWVWYMAWLIFIYDGVDINKDFESPSDGPKHPGTRHPSNVGRA